MLPSNPTRCSGDPVLVEYLIAICDQLGFKMATLSLAVDILHKYTSTASAANLQLVSLVSLFISSKLNQVDFMLLSQVHKFSNHSFTNRDILSMQQRILEHLSFKIICRDTSFHQYVEVLSEISLAFLPASTHKDYVSIVEIIQKFLLKESHASLQVGSFVLAPAILISALVILSQSSGRFPLACRLAKICKVQQNDIQMASLKVLKIVLGRDMYRSLDLQ